MLLTCEQCGELPQLVTSVPDNKVSRQILLYQCKCGKSTFVYQELQEHFQNDESAASKKKTVINRKFKQE